TEAQPFRFHHGTDPRQLPAERAPFGFATVPLAERRRRRKDGLDPEAAAGPDRRVDVRAQPVEADMAARRGHLMAVEQLLEPLRIAELTAIGLDAAVSALRQQLELCLERLHAARRIELERKRIDRLHASSRVSSQAPAGGAVEQVHL